MIKKMILLSILMVGLLLTSGAWATTYYIDWVNGADTNNGTSKSTPWKRAPGMRGCSDNCAAYQTTNWNPNSTATAGNQFILKGGVTWPNAALSWDWIYGSGTQANPIYFGVDQTWYTGGAWARPILDAEGSAPTPSLYYGGIFRAYGNWFTIDNIEFKRLPLLSNTATSMLSIGKSDVNGGEIKNCYFHGWSHGGTSTKDVLTVISSQYQSTDINLLIHNNYIDGSDTTKDMGIGITGSAGHIYNNYIAYLPNGVINVNGRYFWGNTFDHIGDTFSFEAAAHHNTIFNTNGTIMIYNNYIISSGGGGNFILGQGANEILYIFNNVIVSDSNAQSLQLYNAYWGTEQTETKDYVFNNTIQSTGTGSISGPSNASYAYLKNGYAYNNHVMGTAPQIAWQLTTNKVDGQAPATGTNILMTNTVATAAGYVSGGTYPYYAGGATVGAGMDLRSLAAGIPSTTISDAATAALSDTSLGVKYDAGNHRVIGPNRTPMFRGTKWDIGAYQFQGSQVASPQNLKIMP